MQENLIMVCWGEGEDNDTSEGKDGRDRGVPALRLSPFSQISVFVLASLFAAHKLRDSHSTL